MKSPFAHPNSLRLAAALVTLLGLGVAGAAWSLWRAPGTAPGVAEAVPSIVYLPDLARPALSPDEARSIGAQVVASPGEFQAASATAGALVFDAGRMPDLAPGWLQNQLSQGRIIIGLNVPMRDLVRATGWTPIPRPGQQGPPTSEDGFRQNWAGRRFYSLVYHVQLPNRGVVQGRESEQLTSAWALKRAIERNLGTYKVR